MPQSFNTCCCSSRSSSVLLSVSSQHHISWFPSPRSAFRCCPAVRLRPSSCHFGAGFRAGQELRRYRCKLCLRTSTVLTKTPLARLRKAQCWEDYAQALIEGLTVRQRCVVASAKIPPSSGVTASCARWQPIKPHGKRASLRLMRPSSSDRSRGKTGTAASATASRW